LEIAIAFIRIISFIPASGINKIVIRIKKHGRHVCHQSHNGYEYDWQGKS